MAVFDGQAGDAPVFAALDVPTHVTLRRAVRDHQVLGSALTLVGLAGVILLLAGGEKEEAVAAFSMAAFFAAFMWRLLYRGLRTALASPRPAGDAATFVSRPSRRTLVGSVGLALLCFVPMAFGLSPGAFVPLGFGAIELVVVARMRGWERRNGLTLYTVDTWNNKLYAR